jgi:hypothetical protein
MVGKSRHENYKLGVFMTRLGKIARLPREIRDELNVRLQNGEVGKLLVEWLNGLPAAQAVLKARFDGRAISEQNLSEWKAGGYEDWVRHQENCAFASMLTEMSGDLEEVAGETRLEERLVAPLVMALARLLREAEEAPDGTERRKSILDVGRQLSQVRRESLQAERVRMERDRWEHKKVEIALKERQEVEAEELKEAIWEKTKAEHPALRPLAELKAELKGLRETRGRAEGKARVEGDGGAQEEEIAGAAIKVTESNVTKRTKRTKRTEGGESNQIKPNQTCGVGGKEEGRRMKEEIGSFQGASQPPVKPSQSQSNQERRFEGEKSQSPERPPDMPPGGS